MFVSSNSLARKIDFLEVSTRFVEERLRRLLESSEQFSQDVQKYSRVVKSFDALKNDQNRRGNESLDKNLEDYLKQAGDWLENLTEKYEQVMKRKSQECSLEMKRLEQKISRQIYDIQHGELCEKNTTVLISRETAITFSYFSEKITSGSVLIN